MPTTRVLSWVTLLITSPGHTAYGAVRLNADKINEYCTKTVKLQETSKGVTCLLQIRVCSDVGIPAVVLETVHPRLWAFLDDLTGPERTALFTEAFENGQAEITRPTSSNQFINLSRTRFMRRVTLSEMRTKEENGS